MTRSNPRVAVLDYGAANLVSIGQGLVAAGADVSVASDPAGLDHVDALVVPGVGAAAPAMSHLREQRLLDPLRRWADDGRPLLGICLGFQLLFDASEEGKTTTLGVLPGRVIALRDAPTLPHIGWNSVRAVRLHPLFGGIPDGSYLYFVHSYAPRPGDERDILALTEHGRPFVSAVARGSVFGLQFHPEKSAAVGIRLLSNFVALVRDGTTAGAGPNAEGAA
jgi:imidazole glycerol-phosphate synthase subunit HisH